MRVAIQGDRGSFSEAAVRCAWPTAVLVPCRDVAAVIRSVREGRADAGCLPMDNTLAGVIRPTYDLMHQTFPGRDLRLTREVILAIHHTLAAPPGVDLGEITHVHSHPVALEQCSTWLGQHLPDATLVPEWDTAGSAEEVARSGDRFRAAICARSAAEQWNLAVLEERIEDDPTNQTRFLLFQRTSPAIGEEEAETGGPWKTSIIVWTEHRAGLLSAVLQAFAGRGVNLTNLQSRPEPSAPWSYRFYMDVEGHETDPGVADALEAIASLVSRRLVLGSYRSGEPGSETGDGRVPVVPAERHGPRLPLFDRRHHPEGTVVTVGSVAIGGPEPVVIAGPCSVEDRAMVLRVAEAVRQAGGHLLRGGAFKPRTSPYAFQGLGVPALKYLAEARERTGLPVVTEVLSWEDVPLVARYADMLQVGARNMQNFSLLRAAGRSGKPILLKRGAGATIEEWLHAAEYILAQGNPNVVLCERGIRTFERATRHTLDLNAVALVRERSHLPVIADPSHAAGLRSIVPALVRASIAAGAHGVMVEVHPDPDRAVSDGKQSLDLETFRAVMKEWQGVLSGAGCPCG